MPEFYVGQRVRVTDAIMEDLTTAADIRLHLRGAVGTIARAADTRIYISRAWVIDFDDRPNDPECVCYEWELEEIAP